MADQLLIAVLGNRNSGKSMSWNKLFEYNEMGKTVRTGEHLRYLYLNRAQWVDDVFLINGSPQERGIAIEKIITKKLTPTIVLCSIQYVEGMKSTFEYFFNQEYDVFVQWLNPGYSDEKTIIDDPNAVNWLIGKGAVLSKRNGQKPIEDRVEEIRQQILGWATYRDLIRTEF